MSSTTSKLSIESVETEYTWLTYATFAPTESLSSYPADEANMNTVEQHNDATTTQTARTDLPTSANNILFNVPVIPTEARTAQVQHTFAMEEYIADEDNIFSDLDNAMAEDFVPACIERMSSFIQDIDAVLNQT